jgi:hypothetical protein
MKEKYCCEIQRSENRIVWLVAQKGDILPIMMMMMMMMMMIHVPQPPAPHARYPTISFFAILKS